MKKLTLFLMFFLFVSGYAQPVIDPLLSEEMFSRNEDESIAVIVIMKSQYDRTQLNRRADYYVTRAERREFVVNELKAFAEASQYDLRQSLSEMEHRGMVSSPTILWMANALYFNASKAAIQSLALRDDIALIGYAKEYKCIPDGEEIKPASQIQIREITPNVIQVRADQVWEEGYKGEGVVVAIIDSGVNYRHVDLADHLWDGGDEFPHHGYDVYNHDNDPVDDNGHGSHCAGILCGDGTGGSHTGMAPEVTLMCVKSMGVSGYCAAVNIAEGIQWAIEHGCDMFSMSMGLVNAGLTDRKLLRSTCEAALDAGIVAAIAAGNEGNKLDVYPIPYNVRTPGNCPPPYMDEIQAHNSGGLSCSVCVGAVDYNDNAAPFTSHGPVTWFSSEMDFYNDYLYNSDISAFFGLIRPDVCAPGMDIWSLAINGNGYVPDSGTSMATPCVAGCMALMLSKDINLMPSEICRLLEETAVPIEDGKSNVYGFGRVDALAAVEAIPIGGIRYQSYAISDTLGNNNHRLNPGESVTMSLTLNNISVEQVDGVSAVLITEDEHITITQDTIVFPPFAANETITIDDAFAFSVDGQVSPYQEIKFRVKVFVDGELAGAYSDKITVHDYLLKYATVVVTNDYNGDGFLNPGETADLFVMVDNEGNEMAPMVKGVLSTSYPLLTLNETEKSFSSIGAELMGQASFSVTLDASATDLAIIPFSLDLVDADGRHTELTFNYKNACKVFFNLHDSFGDGWEDNYLNVEFSDGTPPVQMTMENGSTSTFIYDLAITSTMTLIWHNSAWSQECSFEIVYEDGTIIYQNSGGFSDTLTFTINCEADYNVPVFCEPVRNLNYETVGQQVVLTWEAPENGTPTAYEIFRGTFLIETTNELKANDIVENGIYDYCVYAIYEDCQSEFVCQEVEMQFATPENPLDEVSVFPNPAFDEVTIQCAGMTKVEVFSIDGGLVQSIEVKDDTCWIEGLKHGVYVIRIFKGELTIMRRLIIR